MEMSRLPVRRGRWFLAIEEAGNLLNRMKYKHVHRTQRGGTRT